jgi:hypothetical protein
MARTAPEYIQAPDDAYHSDEADPRDVAAGMAERDLMQNFADLQEFGGHDFWTLHAMLENAVNIHSDKLRQRGELPPLPDPNEKPTRAA